MLDSTIVDRRITSSHIRTQEFLRIAFWSVALDPSQMPSNLFSDAAWNIHTNLHRIYWNANQNRKCTTSKVLHMSKGSQAENYQTGQNEPGQLGQAVSFIRVHGLNDHLVIRSSKSPKIEADSFEAEIRHPS
jgi:hypothetical protein